MLKKQFVVISLFTSSIVWAITGQAAEDVVISADTLHARVLAASCAACHGTQGNAVGNESERNAAAGNPNARNATLAGRDSADFTSKMLGFKDGSRKATVMHHHAKGLTEVEINQLATFFANQKRVNVAPLVAQTLKVNHE